MISKIHLASQRVSLKSDIKSAISSFNSSVFSDSQMASAFLFFSSIESLTMAELEFWIGERADMPDEALALSGSADSGRKVYLREGDRRGWRGRRLGRGGLTYSPDLKADD
ncbi:unnamed protein product [Ilex paraguariensis]|uniref:Uncharacterized protein n=1 Tax=Ilex paraguariensis TaxID=185542 RepID=A0ABC8T6W0_9AQUA